jgi:hypothetical protein
MTQRKTMNSARQGFPGISLMNDLVSVYMSAWGRHVQALNDVWADVTSADATVSDWPKAWSTLVQTWNENVEDVCRLYTGHLSGAFGAGSPFVTFVIDTSAETAGPQIVPLPPDVDPTRLVATPPVSEDGAVILDPALIVPLEVDGHIEISIAVPKPAPAPGQYLAVVYEDAGITTSTPNPPPRRVIATVLVVFLTTPI